MKQKPDAQMPIGIVIRRTPGVTRWATHAWRVVAVLPGAAPANWKVLRQEGAAIEYHAATLQLDLFASDTEAYQTALAGTPPQVYIALDPDGDRPEPHAVTVSAYEAQDYGDASETMVEPVAMPEGLVAWLAEFVSAHHVETPFVKRKRRNWSDRPTEDGKGDARIRQTADVYRAPGKRRPV